MKMFQKNRLTQGSAVLLAAMVGMAACQLDVANTDDPPDARIAATPAQGETGLIIEGDRDLPDAYAHRHYEFRFHARNGVSLLHWKIEKGSLPPGMKLDDTGLLL